MNPLLAFGPGDLAPWSDPLFLAQPSGPAVLLSFGVLDWGAEMVEKLRGGGIARLQRVGREVRAITATTREEFDSLDVAATLDGAGFVYVQGGNPGRLASTLAGTRFWNGVLERGLPIVATSGGAMALGTRCGNMVTSAWGAGLGAIDAVIAAHWDTFEARFPGFRASNEREAGDGRLIAIEEETAIRVDGGQLEVLGERAVLIKERGAWRTMKAGERCDLPSTAPAAR